MNSNSGNPAYFALISCLLATFVAHSQLRVKEYKKELRCNVDSVKFLPKVRAVSNCGMVDIQWKDQLFSGGCAGTLVRTYTFTDQCDSVITAQQFIALYDQTPPELHNVPANVEVVANQIPPVDNVTVSDNSNQLCEVLFSEVRDGNTIRRTWTSTDSCENATSHTQVITIKPKS